MKQLLCPFLLALTLTSAARSQIVEVQVSGAVTNVILAPGPSYPFPAAVGDPFQATFRFDNSNAPSFSDATADTYPLTQISFSLGSHSAVFSHGSWFAVGHSPASYGARAALTEAPEEAVVSVYFNQLGGVGSLPFLFHSLADFSSAGFALYEMAPLDGGLYFGTVEGVLQSYSLRILAAPNSAVPEPSAYGAVAALLCFGGAIWHRKRSLARSGGEITA